MIKGKAYCVQRGVKQKWNDEAANECESMVTKISSP